MTLTAATLGRTLTLALALTTFAGHAAPNALQLAADRSEIQELSAQFDNALDSENEKDFVGTFLPQGELQGFWGSSKGSAEISKAFHFMLSTFARDKRHTVSNHQIKVDGRRATMYSYLTVFDRKQLAVTGTATFTDTLEKQGGRWYFVRRVLQTDPNVQPIIDSLNKR